MEGATTALLVEEESPAAAVVDSRPSVAAARELAEAPSQASLVDVAEPREVGVLPRQELLLSWHLLLRTPFPCLRQAKTKLDPHAETSGLQVGN